MKRTATIAGKDFDQWMTLAERDPDAFEQLRRAAIDDYIGSVPEAHRDRLRRLQWRIDQERRRAGNPMNACLRISRMMWERLTGEGGLRERLESLGGLLQGRGEAPPATGGGRVLAFAPVSRRADG